VAVAVAVAVAALLALPAGAIARAQSGADQSDPVIVVLEHQANEPGQVARAQSELYDENVTLVYRHALRGYAASVPEDQIDELRADPRVDYVELDAPAEALTTETGATWGLDRIDQRLLPLNGTFTYNSTGAGVRAYIIDTGIRISHTDFGGRAINGYNAINPQNAANDCNGHGTHVAGTTGGTTYGVAKQVTLVAVKVLPCSGTGFVSDIIAGIDWVTADHTSGHPAVANVSIGAAPNAALDRAVKTSISDGVSYAVAAGNGNDVGIGQDACKSSPGKVADAMTVSATDHIDAKPSWANYGKCVDWFAPGVGITSDWYTSDTATATESGTSMAAPETAGVAALYLQTHPTASAHAVRDAIKAQTTKKIVRISKTPSSNLLFTSW